MPTDVQRSCGTCGADITHLRKDARYCQDTKGRCWAVAHRERRRAQNRGAATRRFQKNRRLVWEYLKQHPCKDCGEDYPLVLDFDHIDPTTKRAQISNVVGSWNWETILEEIQKCEVRCANCHRIKTAKQFGWWVGDPLESLD